MSQDKPAPITDHESIHVGSFCQRSFHHVIGQNDLGKLDSQIIFVSVIDQMREEPKPDCLR